MTLMTEGAGVDDRDVHSGCRETERQLRAEIRALQNRLDDAEIQMIDLRHRHQMAESEINDLRERSDAV